MCPHFSDELTVHFTLAQLTATSQKVDNWPQDATIVSNLRALAENILEPVYQHFNRPVIVTSGYRSPAVNELVGGALSSQHCKGQAVDFHVQGVSVLEVAVWIRDHLEFDQLILENFVPSQQNSGWVHCSWNCAGNRLVNLDDQGADINNKILTKFKGLSGYFEGLRIAPTELL